MCGDRGTRELSIPSSQLAVNLNLLSKLKKKGGERLSVFPVLLLLIGPITLNCYFRGPHVAWSLPPMDMF